MNNNEETISDDETSSIEETFENKTLDQNNLKDRFFECLFSKCGKIFNSKISLKIHYETHVI